jgi:hypothetical protein
MDLSFIQILITIAIIIIAGAIITWLNIKSKTKKTVNQEQTTWQKIKELNTKKKELLDQKKEISYKYTSKSIDDQEYSKNINYINEQLKKINTQINEEVKSLTEIQNSKKPEDELRFKNMKIKGDLNELSIENQNLKERISELEDYAKTISNNDNINISDSEKAKIKYYSLIINKYKNIINENEKKTISQIKETVEPNDLTIKNIISKYTPIAYDYKKDYLITLRKIYNYLKSEIDVINSDLKVLFWMNYTKIISEKIANEYGISDMLCAIMQNLKDSNAKVEVIMLEENKIHSFVTTKNKNTFYIFDLTQKIPFDMYKDNNENELFKKYRFKNKKIIRRIYSYNQYEYNDYSEM